MKKSKLEELESLTKSFTKKEAKKVKGGYIIVHDIVSG